MIEEKEEKNMCIINKKVRVYNNFYNFTFRQAIEKKKYRESKFAEPELIYAMWCLLDLAVYLKNMTFKVDPSIFPISINYIHKIRESLGLSFKK